MLSGFYLIVIMTVPLNRICLVTNMCQVSSHLIQTLSLLTMCAL